MHQKSNTPPSLPLFIAALLLFHPISWSNASEIQFVDITEATGIHFEHAGGNRNRWLKIRTIGTKSNREGIGAKVTVTTGALTQIREVASGGSYLSQSSRELELGLGKAAKVDKIVIQWPSGIRQTLTDVEVNQTLVVTEPQK
jgi:hypothetical protein